MVNAKRALPCEPNRLNRRALYSLALPDFLWWYLIVTLVTRQD
jgi:hypothetical protein